MKYMAVGCLVAAMLCGCTKKGVQGIDELKAVVEEAIRENRLSDTNEVTYWEGADREVRQMFDQMFGAVDTSEMTQIAVDVHQVGDYEPEWDLPGSINGRPLKWLVEPSHWIVADMSNKDEDGNGTSLKLVYAAGSKAGEWWLCGVTYDGDAEPQDIEVAGITDKHVTVIAYDEDGRVTDFLQVDPESGISMIEFMAPEDGKEISVLTVGPARHEVVPDGCVVSSRAGEGMMGKVTVKIEDGKVISVFGNRIAQYCPSKRAILEQVRERMESGNHEPSERVVISRD